MLAPWKKLSEVTVRVGYRSIIRKTFRLPDGKESIYDITNDGDVVCILAVTEQKTVILVKQFRPGPEQILLELPGGFIDPGQSPLEAAQAELLQETGYNGDIQFVTTRHFSGYSNRTYHSFVATNCKRVQEQELDPEEFLEVVELPLTEFREHLRHGKLTDTVTGYVGLDALGLL
jgi:ADP-ribose pyrophosphatase